MRMLRFLLLVGCAGLLWVSSAHAFYYHWTGAADSDLNNKANYDVWTGAWAPASVLPGAADRVDFFDTTTYPNFHPTIDSGTFTILYLQFADEITAQGPPAVTMPAGSGGAARNFTGAGTITIASNGNIDTWAAGGPITFSNATLNLTRRAGLYAGADGSGPSGQDLIINTTAFNVGVGGSSGDPTFQAMDANISITPAVDFSLNTYSSNRNLYLKPSAGRTITLAGGVTATPKLKRLYVQGETGGTTFLGNSTTWGGLVTIYDGDLEINHPTALGAVGDLSAGGYTQSMPGSTGALLLTNNITVDENFYLSPRTNNAALIRNKSGNNKLTGTLGTDDGTGVYILQSDAGLFELSGTITKTTWSTGDHTLVLQGAGDGLISGTISGTVMVATGGAKDGGTWGVTKDGNGTWTLNGTNTYIGPTTVANGILSMGTAGTIDSSPTIDVKGGAFFKVSDHSAGVYALAVSQTLQGTGTVTGNINAGYGSAIAPGEGGLGTLNINGNLDLSGGTLNYDMTLDPLVADKLAVSGSLIASAATVNVTVPGSYLGNGSYRLIDYTGAAVSPSAFYVMGIAPQGRQNIAVASVANQLNLVVSGAANLTWVGGTGGDMWDMQQTANWNGAADHLFWTADAVTFGNSSATKTPYISNAFGIVQPGKVAFTNTTGNDYVLSGEGLTVMSEIVASGSGNVTFMNSDISVGGVFKVNGSGKVTLANTGILPSAFAIESGTLAINRVDEPTVSSTFTGAGILQKEGFNTVILNGDNSGFTGVMEVAQGTLRTIGNNALAKTTVLDGATLDVHDNNPGNDPGMSTREVTITGSGVGGIGALITTQGATATSASVKGLVLAADAKIAAIGGIERSILTIDDHITGNGKNLDVVIDNSTAFGTEINWRNCGDVNLGNINVSGGGVLYVGENTSIRALDSTAINLKDKGRLGIYGGATRTGIIDKPILVESTTNGGGIELYLDYATIASPITMEGNLDVNTYSNGETEVLTLSGKLTGAGALTLHHIGNTTTSRRGMVALTSNDNDFTGPVTVGNGGGFGLADPTRDRISLSVGDGGTTGSLGTGDVTFYALAGTSPYNGLYFNRGGAYTVTNNFTLNGAAGMARINSVHVDGKPTFTGNLIGSGNILADGGVTTIAGVMDANFGWVDARGLNGPAILQFAKQVSLYNNDTSKWTAANIAAEGNGTLAFNVGGTGEFTSADIDLLAALGSASDGFMSGSGLGFDTTNAAGGNFTYASPIVDPNGGANVRNLVKLGTGTLTLTGALSYTGNTTVDAGTLAIAGTGILNTPAATVSVLNNATLTAVSITANTLSIGSSAPAAAVPEPSTLLLLSLAGIVGFAMWRRK